MIKFIHTADIHFGMENYGRIDPQTGIHSRLLDFQKALNFCIDRALEQEVDFFLFSGDAYKTTNPSPTQQRLLLNCFLRLYHAKIPIITVVGNHDNPLSFGKANTLDIFSDLPLEGFHVMAKPTSLRLETKNGPVQIVGIPWPSKVNLSLSADHKHVSGQAITDYIALKVSHIIAHMAQELDPSIPAVLAGHLTVASGVFSGSEKRAIYGNDPVLLPSQLAIAPFDYVALGHLHRYQNLNPNGYPAIVYSGSIERIDFGERKEDKGFCLVSIHKKGHTEHEFIKGPMRPFIQIEVTLDAIHDQTHQVIAALKKYPIKRAIIKIIYHLPKGKKDMVDLQAVIRECAHAWFVVSITPIYEPEQRIRRTTLSVDMNLATMVDSYFGAKEDCKARKDILVEKTLKLYQEIKDLQESNAEGNFEDHSE